MGLPEIVFVLIVIVLPLWAIRGFPLPRNRTSRYALLFTVALLFLVYLYNWAMPSRLAQ